MPLVPLPWLGEYVDLGGRGGKAVAAALVSVGLEEEGLVSSGVTGPLVVGQVLAMNPEPQSNGKTINWCSVAVGAEHGAADRSGEGPEGAGTRGIVCGAHNFAVGDKVVVALPGAVLPGDFAIASRKTYGHVSDGMMCSARELGMSEDHDGIIVLSGLGLDPEPGADALGLLGLADEVVEINITPDRGYCFSIRGVAREFSHATGAEFTDPADVAVTGAAGSGGDAFEVKLADETPIHGVQGCDRFVARIIRGVDASKPSPTWMQKRLTQSGMRPISLAVDVTNYVMLELGQPTHAYDLAKLCGPIVVRRARAGEKLTTLDDVERVLNSEDLLITDNGSASGGEGSRVLAIAGVMGGASTEVGETTRDLLIEAAHFDPVSVARSSRRHKLPSEAARRFERGVDTVLQAAAAQRIANLLVEFGGGVIDDAYTDVDERQSVAAIAFNPAQAADLIGVAYPPERVREILTMIGCSIDEHSADPWLVVPPSWRPDLVHGVDLVEEVARIDGFDKIPSVMPVVKPGRGLSQTQRDRRSVSRSLAEFGLTEVLSYPFVGEDVFDAFGLEQGDERRRAVRLVNPLDQTAPFMRTAILQTLVGAAQRNLSRGFTDFGLFELGKVFQPAADMPAAGLPGVAGRPTDEELAQLGRAVPRQDIHVAGLCVGNRTDAGVLSSARPADWADAVEAARRALGALHVDVETHAIELAPWHPGRCAALVLRGVTLGAAGELHPHACEALGLPPSSVAFEFNLDAASELSRAMGTIRAVGLKNLPPAKEDFAFAVDADVPAAAVLEAVTRGINAGDGTPGSEGWAEQAQVFDVFEGAQLGEGKKSVAVAVRLRADHTLSAQEIAGARKRAIKHAEKALKAELRS